MIIKEIYKKPKAKKTNGEYIDLIGDILVNYLYTSCKKSNTYNVTLTIGDIMEIVGLVNGNYTVGNRHKKELSEVLDINIISVYYFYNNTRGEFKRIIERALNSLNNRRVLTYSKVRTIYIYDKETDNYYYRDATKEEDRHITNIEKDVIKEMGFNKLSEVFGHCMMNTFQNKVNKKLPKIKSNNEVYEEWIYYFYGYNLNIGDTAIEIEHRSIKDKINLLNNKSINKVNKKLKGNDKTLLINTLIDIIKYDLEISDEIIKEYECNKKDRERRIYKAEKEINKIKEEPHQQGFDFVDYYNYTKTLE